MRLLKTSIVGLFSFVLVNAKIGQAGPPLKRADVLQRLEDGNKRFAEGKSKHPNNDTARIQAAAADPQTPFAIVLACSDARVPVELLFDQGIGDLFVVRVEGNAAGPTEVASLEHAVRQFPHVPILLVLGHTSCRAVHAAIEKPDDSGLFKRILDRIQFAVDMGRKANPHLEGKDLAIPVTQYNVRRSQEVVIRSSEYIKKRAQDGPLTIYGALYNTETGRLKWLGQHPDNFKIIFGVQSESETPKDDEEDVKPFMPEKEK